ncbi:maleylpyruvate isomerase family mycothiol-dependent enzyme [Leucobacter sp. M11]|uniref:maleylpyruvate isomerase family mycothiol-dependent enzyme n=1 Tax=Leucobacter sp. M11 TaxID=2993565 RepID=UPI002D7EF987|nr:maleylpyruvate isomerase family mycothiol-dependent enzyme [Leucobacter sp. M11]MEB4613934.1 maleylpyruvate isomerase family mycothiol-dependent enzyme [Leucobacter sp. M11]
MRDVWTAVHRERAALLDDLGTVPASAWDTPSPCPGWTVHDVLAHLVDDASTTSWSFARDLVRSRFAFDLMNEQGVARELRADPAETLEAFRAVRHRRSGAPAPAASRLVEIIVHGEDLRRPLGLRRRYPLGPTIAALRYQRATSPAMGGGRERATGITLVLTDATLTGTVRIGSGPEARGSALALLLALAGRPVRRAELSGPGAEQLRVLTPG